MITYMVLCLMFIGITLARMQYVEYIKKPNPLLYYLTTKGFTETTHMDYFRVIVVNFYGTMRVDKSKKCPVIKFDDDKKPIFAEDVKIKDEVWNSEEMLKYRRLILAETSISVVLLSYLLWFTYTWGDMYTFITLGYGNMTIPMILATVWTFQLVAYKGIWRNIFNIMEGHDVIINMLINYTDKLYLHERIREDKAPLNTYSLGKKLNWHNVITEFYTVYFVYFFVIMINLIAIK
jgi:hypothetical protein